MGQQLRFADENKIKLDVFAGSEESDSKNEFDAGYIELATKVNAHICECEECKSQYYALLDYVDAFEKVVNSDSAYDTLKTLVLKLLKTQGTSDSCLLKIIKRIRNDAGCIKTVINLKINSLRELFSSNMQNGLCFYHPTSMTLAKSFSSVDNKSESSEIKSILVDGDSNRIAIEEDGTLSIQMDKGVCDGSYVVLYSLEDEDSIMTAEIIKNSSGDREATFYNVIPGEYSLIILQ